MRKLLLLFVLALFLLALPMQVSVSARDSSAGITFTKPSKPQEPSPERVPGGTDVRDTDISQSTGSDSVGYVETEDDIVWVMNMDVPRSNLGMLPTTGSNRFAGGALIVLGATLLLTAKIRGTYRRPNGCGICHSNSCLYEGRIIMKKLLAFVLAAVLLGGAMAFPALAATSNGGINFTAGNVDPGDPTDPNKWVPGISTNQNLYFGSQIIFATVQSYNSVNGTAGIYNGVGEVVGYAVLNNTGSTTQQYSLTVEMSEFQNGATTVMQGYTLTMTPDGAVKSALPSNPSAPPTASAGTITAGAGNGAMLFQAGPGEAQGAWGSNWKGNLTVLGGTALLAGDAEATLTWTLQNT